MTSIRSYQTSDYEQVKGLYLQTEFYGGQFDTDRDSFEKLRMQIEDDEQSILVYEEKNEILGTVTLLENKRTAFLFRFAAQSNDVATALYKKACLILRERGHHQVLVYSPLNVSSLDERYIGLGMNQGNSYTCYWSEIKTL